MGPVWDYDWAFSGPSLAFWNDYELKETELCTRGTWFYALLNRSPEFRSAVKSRYNEIEDTVRAAAYEFKEENAKISKAAHKDYLLWHFYNGNASYQRNFERDFNVLMRRLDWLSVEFNSY